MPEIMDLLDEAENLFHKQDAEQDAEQDEDAEHAEQDEDDKQAAAGPPRKYVKLTDDQRKNFRTIVSKCDVNDAYLHMLALHPDLGWNESKFRSRYYSEKKRLGSHTHFHRWTNEELLWLRKEWYHYTHKTLVRRFNRKFKASVTVTAMRNAVWRYLPEHTGSKKFVDVDSFLSQGPEDDACPAP